MTSIGTWTHSPSRSIRPRLQRTRRRSGIAWPRSSCNSAKRRILEIVFLNCRLDDATLVPTIRKPFDVLADGLIAKNSRGDKTPLELFLKGVAGWDAALRRRVDDRKSKPD